MSRLPEGEIEVRIEEVYQMIRNNPGKGFNRLDRLCKPICARQTLKKILYELEEKKRILKIKTGTQNYEFYINEGRFKVDKEYESILKAGLKDAKETLDFLKKNIYKLSDFEKMAFTGICYNLLSSIALNATRADVIAKGEGRKHLIFHNLIEQSRKLQYQMIHDLMLTEDGTGDPPEFCNLFFENYARKRDKNDENYLKFVSRKNVTKYLENVMLPLLRTAAD